jgi:hypothetical protein
MAAQAELQGLVAEGVITAEVAARVVAMAEDFYLGLAQQDFIARAVKGFRVRAKVERLRRQPLQEPKGERHDRFTR